MRRLILFLMVYMNERVMTLFLKDGRLFIRDDTPPGDLGSLTDSTDLPVTKDGENRFSFSPVGTSAPTLFTFIPVDKGRIEYMNIGGRALKRK